MNERTLLDQAIEAVSHVVRLRIEDAAWSSEPFRDSVVSLTRTDGMVSETLCVEVKHTVNRLSTLHMLHDHASRIESPTLLVAPYLSRRMGEACLSIGLNFIDAAGNAFIDLPGCYVYINGRPERKELSAAKNPQAAWTTSNGLRIVFSLLTNPGLISRTQRDMAQAAGVALGSVGRTLDQLKQQGYISHSKSRSPRLLEVNELAQTWVQHYGVSLRHKLKPRKYSLMGNGHWSEMDLANQKAAWGSEVAADRLDGYLKPVSATIYSWERDTFLQSHRLRPDPGGAIEVLDAFWTFEPNEKNLAPALLIYADLMEQQDSRCKDAAQRIWEHMAHAQH